MVCISRKSIIRVFNALLVILFYRRGGLLSSAPIKRIAFEITEVLGNNIPDQIAKCHPNVSATFENDVSVLNRDPMCERSTTFRRNMIGRFKRRNAWTNDEKPKIYDCYGVLEKIAWIWRVVAVFPFTIRYSMGIKKYRTNVILATYSILLCIACIANLIIGVIQFRNRFSKKRITMLTTTSVLRTTSGLICMFISSFWRVVRHKEVTESVESMAMLEAFLENMGCRLNHERKAKTVFTLVLTTFLTIVWLMIYDLYSSKHSVGGLQWLLWVTPLIAQVIDLTIFVLLVGLLGLEFRALNDKIRTIVTRANASPPKIIVSSDFCAENLELAAKAHYNICAIGKRINSFFDWDVVINVITAFVILSSTLYYIFVEVQREGKTDTVRIWTYLHWELIHSVPMIVIVAICNWTTHQSHYAGKFIHEIQVETTDSRLYEAVKSFSLQLHHQKLEFTGGGLFPLNSSLLQAMVGNITTYLVILIQFHPSLDN